MQSTSMNVQGMMENCEWFLLSGVFLFFFLDDRWGIVSRPAIRHGSLGTYNLVADMVTLIVAGVFAMIGVIRFVKWAWKD
jgi:hypothetical protein